MQMRPLSVRSCSPQAAGPLMTETGAKLPKNNRKADQEKDDRPGTNLAIQFDYADAEQIRRISMEADMSMKATASRLLAFALETLAQRKKQREGNYW
jgi:hypothetical protein